MYVYKIGLFRMKKIICSSLLLGVVFLSFSVDRKVISSGRFGDVLFLMNRDGVWTAVPLPAKPNIAQGKEEAKEASDLELRMSRKKKYNKPEEQEENV
jgi:hypothetical protein